MRVSGVLQFGSKLDEMNITLINRLLLCVFVFAIVVISVKVLYPSGQTISYRIFDGIYGICVSYVPSYFVYILAVYLPRKRDQNNISVFVANHNTIIWGDAQAILNEAAKQAGIDLPQEITVETVDAIFALIDPRAQAPMIKPDYPFARANWLEFLYERRLRSGKNIDLLLGYMMYLESEHVKLLTEIRNSIYFMQLDSVARLGAGNKDFSFMATSFTSYYDIALELSRYNEQHFKGVAWSSRRR